MQTQSRQCEPKRESMCLSSRTESSDETTVHRHTRSMQSGVMIQLTFIGFCDPDPL